MLLALFGITESASLLSYLHGQWSGFLRVCLSSVFKSLALFHSE